MHVAEFAAAEVVAAVRAYAANAPLHIPHQLALVDEYRKRFPAAQAVLCFDSAFHASMPDVARYAAFPEPARTRYTRFGFHGLSYEYIASCIDWERYPRAIVAHLGSGASLCAMVRGRSVDTTMGFSPLGGIVMATRAGDIDPGALLGMIREHRGDVDAVETFLASQCGLAALSGGASDMRDLLRKPAQTAASAAVDAFVRSVAKAAASFVPALGGFDLLVFTGGIGEGSAEIRARVATSLAPFGLHLDELANVRSAEWIHASTSRVAVARLATDEAKQMAVHAAALCARAEEGGPPKG